METGSIRTAARALIRFLTKASQSTILYVRNYETQVIALAKAFRRDNPGRRGNISVPQLSLAIEDHAHVDSASIVHVVSVSKDPEADGYLKARYGRTLIVRDTETLRSTRTPDAGEDRRHLAI